MPLQLDARQVPGIEGNDECGVIRGVGGGEVRGGRHGPLTASASEQFHPVGEERAERQPTAMDAGLDGAERDAGHPGDLGVVVAFDVEEDDRGPLVAADGRERRSERAATL